MSKEVAENEAEFVPSICPSCGAKLEWNDSGVDLVCPNELCPAQTLYHIEHFCRVMGIEEMSATTLEKFNLEEIIDLYNLDFQYLSSKSGFGEKSLSVIREQIEKSLKEVLPATLIEAFGIHGVGNKTAEALTKTFKKDTAKETIQKFLSANIEELCLVDGIGYKTAVNIKKLQPYCTELFEKLLSKGLTFKETSLLSTKLLGKKICMTGASPDGRSRSVLAEILQSHGAEVQGGVTKTTDILIAENPNGNSSKLKNARKNGTKVVSYVDFFSNL